MRDSSTGRFVKVSMDGRTCLNCDSTTTYLEDGKFPVWFHYKNGYICKKCRAKLMDNPKQHPIHSPRRLLFKGKSQSLKQNPRSGICSLCGAVKGIDCKRTHMHHITYHDKDILKDTIELCVSCHVKQHGLGRRTFDNRFFI